MMTGKYSHAHLMGENSSNWKGDDAGYHALHKWVPRGMKRYFQWANISRKYLRDLSDWKRLCKKCHMLYDEILNKGWITRKTRYGIYGRKNMPVRGKNGQFIKSRPKLQSTDIE